jgi:hypothetical protein
VDNPDHHNLPPAPHTASRCSLCIEAFTALAMKLLRYCHLYPLNRRLDGPRVSLDVMEKGRTSCSWESNPSRPSCSLVAISTELSRIRTTTCRPTFFWLPASCSLGLFFDREDGGTILLRNVGELLRTKENTYYTVFFWFPL